VLRRHKPCALCGRPTEAHNRHVRFRLPDPVKATPEQERAPGIWMSHGDPETSVMMQVPNVGPFVRALLPVRLTGGFTLTFGVWVAIHPDDLQRAFRVWWEPEYRDLVLEAWLANTLPEWDLLSAPAVARVRDVEHTPYITESTDEGLARVLADEWPHTVLDGLP
jgi:hypothetical protein